MNKMLITLLIVLPLMASTGHDRRPLIPYDQLDFDRTFYTVRLPGAGPCCYCGCMKKDDKQCYRLCGRVVQDGKERGMNKLEMKQCEALCKRGQ